MSSLRSFIALKHAKNIPSSVAERLDLQARVEHILPLVATALLAKNQLLCTAESCTGGLIAGACTDLAGSSQWFERGYITYSNMAKQENLGVSVELLKKYGAVSQEVAFAMAQGALLASQAHWSIAVTGIAGPTGATEGKPIGYVCFGFAYRENLNSHMPVVQTQVQYFQGDRQSIRLATVEHALRVLLERVENVHLMS